MKKIPFKYLSVTDDLEDTIDAFNPKALSKEQAGFIDNLNGKDSNLLPAKKFIEVVEQAPIAISITNKKAKILYANKAFCNTTGYSLAEVIGKNESMLSYKSTPREVYYDLWHSITRNKVWNGQLINRHKNGSPYLADLTISPMQDELQNTTHYLGMHRNISENYEVKMKLQNHKLLLESVINASSVAMVVLDKDNKVILDNLQYKALISDLGHQEPAQFFLELLAVEIGDIRSHLIKNPDGFNNLEIRIDSQINQAPLWFSCSGQIFKANVTDPVNFFDSESQDYLLISASNVTRQKSHQEKIYLQTLKTMLAEEEQTRSIRETLLGAIHQVSQPLNQIQAAIQLMHNKDEQGTLLDLLQQLESSCQQTVSTLHHCVPEILPTAITPINLNQILHEIMMLSKDIFLSNGIIIEWAPSPVLANILGTENKLRTIFKQLIDNAVYALSKNKKTERCIKIVTTTRDQNVIASISDTGPGIPDNQKTKVFHPFFTTKKMGGIQAGMGLVVAKELVTQFKGSIVIDPEYQQGCRFIVSFPATKQLNTMGTIDERTISNS